MPTYKPQNKLCCWTLPTYSFLEAILIGNKKGKRDMAQCIYDIYAAIQ